MLGCRVGIVDSQEKAPTNTTDFRWAVSTVISGNNTLYQDTACTNPVTAVNQTVRGWLSYDSTSRKFTESVGAKQIRYVAGVGGRPCIEINTLSTSSVDFSSMTSSYAIKRVNVTVFITFSNNGTDGTWANRFLNTWTQGMDGAPDQMSFAFGYNWGYWFSPTGVGAGDYDISSFISDTLDGTVIRTLGFSISYNTTTKAYIVKMTKNGSAAATTIVNTTFTPDVLPYPPDQKVSLNGAYQYTGSIGQGKMKVYTVELYDRLMSETEMVNRCNTIHNSLTGVIV
jgi:hypothetical protein